MGFLSGPVTLECFRVDGEKPRQFGPEHVKILERFAIGQTETSSPEQADVGFLAGRHLFDLPRRERRMATVVNPRSPG